MWGDFSIALDLYKNRAEDEAALENIPAWPSQAFTVTSCNSAIMVLPNQYIEHTKQEYVAYVHVSLLLF